MTAMNLNTNTYPAISASTTSSSITLIEPDVDESSIIIVNAGSAPALVVSGSGATTAVWPTGTTPSPGTVVPGGAVMTMTKNVYHNTIAAVCGTGTTTIYVKLGAGE